MTRRSVGGIALTGLVGLSLASCSGWVSQDPTVAPRAIDAPYDRAAFGRAWADVDKNGCDTRNDILQRDLVATVVADDRCVVLEGILEADPYSGATVTFVRGTTTSREVQIDHIYALADAYDDGAAQWEPEKRLRFANDTRNLVASKGSVNAAKGARAPSVWGPTITTAELCPYLRSYQLIAEVYGLQVDDVDMAYFEAQRPTCRNLLTDR